LNSVEILVPDAVDIHLEKSVEDGVRLTKGFLSFAIREYGFDNVEARRVRDV
jgi:hypothetical protein